MAAGWSTQRGWQLCGRCQGLWFGPNSGVSRCPAGGTHDIGDDSKFSLLHDADPLPPAHQNPWHWCEKCQGLWFGADPASSACPAGGSHSLDGSGMYCVADGAAAAAGRRGWRLCANCQGLWSGSEAASVCPAGGAHTAGDTEFCVPKVTRRVRVHTKAISPPTIPLPTMFQGMREVYAAFEIDVEWASHEELDLPHLSVVDCGDCRSDEGRTRDQQELFAHRNSAAEDEAVIYFVQSTLQGYLGCAAHPPTRPGAVISAVASSWTLAHEIGHVLGLLHGGGGNRLMTTSTKSIAKSPPDLTPGEFARMALSPLLAVV